MQQSYSITSQPPGLTTPILLPIAVVTHTFFRFAVEENSQYMHTINTLEPNAWMHKVWAYTGFHQLVFAVIFFLPTGVFIRTWDPESTVSEYK